MTLIPCESGKRLRFSVCIVAWGHLRSENSAPQNFRSFTENQTGRTEKIIKHRWKDSRPELHPERVIFPPCFGKRSSPLHVPQRRRRHRAPEQQQGEDVRVQQQRAGQTLQGVEGQQTKGLFTQVQTGIKIPEQGIRKRGKRNKDEL